MNKTVKTNTLALCECGMMIALSFVLDYLSKAISGLFPNPWVAGGGITLAMVPIVYIAFRRGNLWGIGSGLVYSGLQIATGFYLPPAGTVVSIILCVLLDYVVAFTVLGFSKFFADMIKSNKNAGYAFGSFVVCMLRFLCSFLSGVILWGEYGTNWGIENIWVYSFCYNISYMLPNAIITAVIIVSLCRAIDPVTLKRNTRD
ncbi:MAG: energy-coupled thiamine transporter ThiT [Clostridia bacterium]|nr:energy-coupled thiamine transporter ThiT [Clostridia bacterium]